MTSKRLLWAVLIAFAANLGLTLASILIARSTVDTSIRENEKTHCIVYDLIHRSQQEAPPTTPQAKEFAQAVTEIRHRLRCEEK